MFGKRKEIEAFYIFVQVLVSFLFGTSALLHTFFHTQAILGVCPFREEVDCHCYVGQCVTLHQTDWIIPKAF